ncbi:hypothetical protein BDM02DRAFT_3186425 [Thelephora ganbajun]|uniref:Uncharacterized protein n=1 Tax=Thelephora ganbajun TaxID=370292 RepID=A0ACB6ZI28_THEGA|nr:hypothetical protein BDM02DRAFT_3186425 [Thelephora ganbajun]
MPNGPGYHNRQLGLAANLRGLLLSLSPSTYDKIAPEIEYWIDYAITERFTTAKNLAELVSSVAWEGAGSKSEVSRFLKEFRDEPHRPEQVRSFVDDLCLHTLRWFAVASADRLQMDHYRCHHDDSVASHGSLGFIQAASLVGHLIECGLLDHELVRRHLIKPLTAYQKDSLELVIRANAIYQLFITAGNTLLQGLLKSEDVRVCFERLDVPVPSWARGGPDKLCTLDAEKLNEFRTVHATWLRRREEEEQRNAAAVEVLAAEVETPVAFVSQDLPAAHTSIDSPSSIFQYLEPISVVPTAESTSTTFVNVHDPAVSSPTLSISTVSDSTPTELDDGIGEGSGERVTTRHETFYFEDGNVEILCGDTLFRVHSTIISFASSKIRNILSQQALLHAPMPEGCARITLTDSAEDFAVLLKMIYTPGFPARNRIPEFATFASLLRMATKYGFSDVREGLVEDLKGAYPTKWEDFETAKVLGEDVFGLPKPHPNAVLKLFLEQRIEFALPFAAYRAGLGGPSALASDERGTVLPRLTLASIIDGMGKMRRVGIVAAHSIVYVLNMGVCSESACSLNVGINRTEQRIEALNKIFNVMVGRDEGDLLSAPSLGNIVCADCAKRLEATHLSWRKRFFLAKLPSLLGWGGWEGI